ncbi:hypothetical protein HMPREF9141_1627 [Prevotella multiformis DSM 16608]|uniref:Uncharacterized protein n=1 Tax=Prevotella multiformis DSM 16608 TaxID=888743 RepID=F0F7R0_9BACT|nr:hypothetical protein HMPREF9141_1627 [Prevotella multiformis DSM 16608]
MSSISNARNRTEIHAARTVGFVPSGWDSDSQPLGTLFPAVGNHIPGRWESQSLWMSGRKCAEKAETACGRFHLP